MKTRSLQSFLAFHLLLLSATSVVKAQTYDFSAATAQLQDNLSLYGDRVIAIIEQGDRGEIFRFQAGAIGTNTKTGIASCTKWLSGAVVLICAEHGYLRLDDRIGQYLPIFDTYGKGDITIRQCFAMKSGLQLNGPESSSYFKSLEEGFQPPGRTTFASSPSCERKSTPRDYRPCRRHAHLLSVEPEISSNSIGRAAP